MRKFDLREPEEVDPGVVDLELVATNGVPQCLMRFIVADEHEALVEDVRFPARVVAHILPPQVHLLPNTQAVHMPKTQGAQHPETRGSTPWRRGVGAPPRHKGLNTQTQGHSHTHPSPAGTISLPLFRDRRKSVVPRHEIATQPGRGLYETEFVRN